MLIWETSSSGELSFSNGYESLQNKLSLKDWANSIWRHFIPPRYSFLIWRILWNQLPTDDRLQKCGIPIVSISQLCYGAAESSLHLFLHCSFAQRIWRWLAVQFGTSLIIFNSLYEFGEGFFRKPFSSQLYNLRLTTGMFTFMAIWKARNKLRFDDRSPNFSTMCCSILAWLRQTSVFTPGHCKGVLDSRLLSSLGVHRQTGMAPKIHYVLWHPPIFPWIKVNTDGLAKGNLGPAACGGIFRDASGTFLGGFGQYLGYNSSFYAELYDFILAIKFSFAKSWHNLWLESDSSSVIACISSRSFSPPWTLRVRWFNCLSKVGQMNFHYSHIFREGNAAAAKMANLSISNTLCIWYDSPPDELQRYLQADFLGLPSYHFS